MQLKYVQLLILAALITAAYIIFASSGEDAIRRTFWTNESQENTTISDRVSDRVSDRMGDRMGDVAAGVLHEVTDPLPVKWSPRHKVIIQTYMRSGSSFTGDLLQQSPDVFYIYEPLQTTEHVYSGRLNLKHFEFIDNTSLSISGSEQDKWASYVDIMMSVLNCEFDKLDTQTLQQLHMSSSKSTKDIRRCIQSFQAPSHEDIANCIKPATESCKAASVIATKVIRASMRQVVLLLASDPKLKVIHLIRDPRGCLNSRIQFGLGTSKLEMLNPRVVCSNILRDIEVSKSTLKRFPGRILTVRYEDIAEEPVLAASQLYTFLDLQMTPTIEEYIMKITYSGLLENCNICTTRPNATETAYSWRKELSFERISVIQQECAQLMAIMGHKPLSSSSEAKDFMISTKFKEYDPELMKLTV